MFLYPNTIPDISTLRPVAIANGTRGFGEDATIKFRISVDTLVTWRCYVRKTEPK